MILQHLVEKYLGRERINRSDSHPMASLSYKFKLNCLFMLSHTRTVTQDQHAGNFSGDVSHQRKWHDCGDEI